MSTSPPPPSPALPTWEVLALVVLFGTWLLSPVLAGLLGVESAGEALENRALKAFEAPTLDTVATATWGLRFEGWLNDHLPLRTQLLELDHHVDFHILGDSPFPDQIIVGSNGWIWRLDRLHGPKAELAPANKLIRNIKELDAIAEAAGLQLLVVIAPTKSSVYPEKIPPGYQRWHRRNIVPAQRQLQAYAQEPGSPLLDTWTLLAQERARLEDPATPVSDPRLRTLFRPTDRHWNLETGRFIAKRIIEALDGARWIPEAAPALDPTYVEVESELSKVYLKLGISEPYTTLQSAPGLAISQRRALAAGTPTSRHQHTPLSKVPVNPQSLLILRDSFLDYASSKAKPAQNGTITTLASQFQESVFVHQLVLKAGQENALRFVGAHDYLVIELVQDNTASLTDHFQRFRSFVTEVAERRKANAAP